MSKIMANLDTPFVSKNKDEAAHELFTAQSSETSHLLLKAIELKRPEASQLIREVIKRQISLDKEESKGRTVCTDLFSLVRTHLFLASGNSESKIWSAVRDVLTDESVKFQPTPNNGLLIDMMAADAVNILQNKQEVVLANTKKPEPVEIDSWQPLVQKIEINGHDRASHKQSIEQVK